MTNYDSCRVMGIYFSRSLSKTCFLYINFHQTLPSEVLGVVTLSASRAALS
jgi:hypothetical protein